jgi:hypothetical protein
MSDRPTPRTDAINSEDGLHLEPLYDKMHDLAEELERELAETKEQRDRLAEAAGAVVDRWATPLWKEAPHTGKLIRALADALDWLNADVEARQ